MPVGVKEACACTFVCISAADITRVHPGGNYAILKFIWIVSSFVAFSIVTVIIVCSIVFIIVIIVCSIVFIIVIIVCSIVFIIVIIVW
jgi:hypothetical protein